MDSNYRRGSGAAGGRGHGRGGGGRENNKNQPNQGGGRGWDAPQRGYTHQPPSQQQWVSGPQVQGDQSQAQQARSYRPQQTPRPQQPHQRGVGPAGGRPGVWTGRPWGLSPPAPSPAQSLPPTQTPPQPSPGELGMQKHKTSEKDSTISSSLKSKGNQVQAIRGPGMGGAESTRSINLLVNHFLVKFHPEKSIYHYNFDVKPDSKELAAKTLRKPELLAIREKLFSDDEDFQNIKSAYDGKTNIFTAVRLSESKSHPVEISDNEHVKSGSYTVEIKSGKELKLSKLQDYISEKHSDVPRDVLQGLDLVMKENPTKQRIVFGQGFYSNQRSKDLGSGVEIWRGFNQSLKTTLQGLSLCLDYSVLAFVKPLPVIQFLKDHIPQSFYSLNKASSRRNVEMALKGLKVRVTYRVTKQKYIIASLAGSASETSFDRNNPNTNTTEKITIEKHFKEQWDINIEHPNIPCLELGKNGRSNMVPMEFCVLVEGQRFQPKEYLDNRTARCLESSVKTESAPAPIRRKEEITGMVVATDGPCGDVSQAFEIVVDTNMTKVAGRIIPAPSLKVGGRDPVVVPGGTCQWSLAGRYLVDRKSIQRWALIDFTGQLNAHKFIDNLKQRSKKMGIEMENPLVWTPTVTKIGQLPSADELEDLLKKVVAESKNNGKRNLQMIVCVLHSDKEPIYKYLKWLSETQIGVVTQCCVMDHANAGKDPYLTNLCLKINAMLGGSNFELVRENPHFIGGEHMMFIGADVNHPAPNNKSCPSIAAVVGTVNWPAANRYAARISPQAHRTEKIINFEAMGLDLINTYARLNKVKPTKIVVFRDGVSDGQFDMVLNQELADLKKAIFEKHNYNPKITFVVAQKRHQTRLFVENGKENENVPPGTVVDKVIVNPDKCNFYLCSHHGIKGTSKLTHYYLLSDENSFETNQLQQLIYHMCFTFARCTKPVSVVPPVYYADLVAYRGRMYQEVVMETESPAASFDQRFYNLHPNLENTMFFI